MTIDNLINQLLDAHAWLVVVLLRGGGRLRWINLSAGRSC
jgi:hypothetical protein